MTTPQPPKPSFQVRASQLLRIPAVWVVPAATASVLVLVLTLVYLGSVIDPTGHLHGLPATVVNEDAGVTVGSQRINLGQQVAAGLIGSPAVSSRLSLRSTTLTDAKTRMDAGKEYATVVIPPKFTASLLSVSGVPTPAESLPSRPAIQLLTNPRAGTVGVGLATGVLQPALSQASRQIGQRLLPLSALNGSNPAATALLSDPVTVAVVPYRPLPSHSGLGLSAFYFALLTIFCGFLGAIIVNPSVDAALGYSTTEVGPWWRQRQPVPISRWQTLLTKWVMAVFLTVVLTGILLGAATGILGMDTPHWGYLWLLSWFAAAVVAIGTLALFAVLGLLGQLIALLVFIYLSLASSGGTVPLQALSGFFRFLATFEPLRQILGGVRAILYFDAQGTAGLTRAWVATALGLVFWLVLGTAVTTWYDRRGLYRIQPELLGYIDRVARAYMEQHRDIAAPAATEPGPAAPAAQGTEQSGPPTPPQPP
jgi:YhgE/Pip-like protein